MLRLHRGIAVAEDRVDDVIASIKADGLTATGPRRRIDAWPFADPRRLLDGDVRSIDTRPGHPRAAVCAADALGASHYACHHNRTTLECAPLIIEIDVQSAAVCVDGSDLLYRLFSQYARVEAARSALTACYGEAMLHYAERAWASDDPKLRIALCDIAVWDAEVVAAHYENGLVIEGKFGTLFRSAFKVMLPVAATAIVSVRRIADCPSSPRPDVSIGALTI